MQTLTVDPITTSGHRMSPYHALNFGDTVMAIVTDEHNLLGKCRQRYLMPGTTGILTLVKRILGYGFTPHLPAL